MPPQMTDKPDSHVFTVRFHIADATESGDHSVRAYEDAGLQDLALCLPDADDGIFEAHFERAAQNFPQAVLSALADLQRVFPEAELVRIEPDDLTTIAGMSRRINRSHESVRLLVQGKRGPGGFPRPAGTLDTKTQVWRWHEVVAWFERAMNLEIPESEHAAFLATINDILELRRIAPRVIDTRKTADAMSALLPVELRP